MKGEAMQISNAEWRIMKIIWMEGKQTSRDLIAVLSERFDWSKSTIKTLLTRLVEKGCLTREKSGKAFVYSALLKQDQSLDLVVDGCEGQGFAPKGIVLGA